MSVVVGIACDECNRIASSVQLSRVAARLTAPDLLRFGVARSTEALLAAGGSTDDDLDRCASCARVRGPLPMV